MKNKILKWCLRILAGFVSAVLFVLFGFSFCERMTFISFYTNSEKLERIPGLWEGYIPQGYTAINGETRLACGYMSNGEASRIYILKTDKYAQFVEMKTPDGESYTGHTGGIAVCGDNVFVTGMTGCDIFSLADITDGDGIATKKGEFDTPLDPAYCTVFDGLLYVGSFYRAGNFETPMEHRFTTPAGDSNTAIIAAYELDGETGLPSSESPLTVYSVTSLVQGMAFIGDGRIVLSTSYGFARSHLYVYDLGMAVGNECIELNSNQVPLVYLDSACLVDDISAPPMAEEIIYKDGRIYIMNESASMKYLFGKLTSGNYIQGYKYE